VAPPLCTWIVAACLSATCGADDKDKKRSCGGGGGSGSGLFGTRRHLAARRRGGARSGEAISVSPSTFSWLARMSTVKLPNRQYNRVFGNLYSFSYHIARVCIWGFRGEGIVRCFVHDSG
jgi:hypothetical protein